MNPFVYIVLSLTTKMDSISVLRVYQGIYLTTILKQMNILNSSTR